jgi:hypothetical protein
MSSGLVSGLVARGLEAYQADTPETPKSQLPIWGYFLLITTAIGFLFALTVVCSLSFK